MPLQPGVQLVNRTRGVIIAETVEIAASPWERMRGLIGRPSLPVGFALVIRPCRGVHSFGMSISIAVGHVDAGGRVVRILHDLKPWRLGPIVWKSAWVVELPAGTARRTDLHVGDVVEVIEGDNLEERRLG